MKKFHHVVNWAALILIILLILLSIYGAFLGSANAQNFFNSRLMAVYWFILLSALLTGLLNIRKLVNMPGLLLIHLGCILVLIGAIYSSEAGHQIQKKFFGIDKIRRGQMLINQNQESDQVELEKYNWIKELPFSIKLKDFRIVYYEPRYLEAHASQGNIWKIPVKLNTVWDSGGLLGKVKILKQFQNFKIISDGATRRIIDSNEAGYNPALEVQIELPDGSKIIRYVFEHFKSHANSHDNFIMTYGGTVQDYISNLAVIKNGKTIAEKNVEVNHPLHFGGYYFYQHSYNPRATQYTVLMVVSDSGLSIVYGGYLMLIAGVFWHFWLSHLFKKQRCN